MSTQLVKVLSYALSAGVEKVFPGGRFLRLITADAAVDVTFYDESNQPIGTASQVLGGFQLSVDPADIDKRSRLIGFAKVGITSATNQTITVALSRQPIEYDRLTGSISATVASGATVTQSRVTVSSASAALLATNSNRKRAWVRNLSATETMYVTDDGTAATTANGYPIGPGEEHAFETQDGLNAIRGAATDIAAAITEERA